MKRQLLLDPDTNSYCFVTDTQAIILRLQGDLVVERATFFERLGKNERDEEESAVLRRLSGGADFSAMHTQRMALSNTIYEFTR